MICCKSLSNIKIESKWILVSLSLVQSYFLFVYLKVSNCATEEGDVKHTHTNSQSRGARNKGINEWVYVRSICGRGDVQHGELFGRQTLPHPYQPPSAAWKSGIARGWDSKGLWVSVTVMIKNSNAERERTFQKGRGRAWQAERVLKEEMKPTPSPPPLSMKFPRASNSIPPQLLCKTKVNTLSTVYQKQPMMPQGAVSPNL